ncbi:MAG TPA: 23S rRNA (pseudouridine(1915)-N(3))-methyltransferase RlmH [Gammaproteobacteria bacterium]|jgi:23S rRNA (pseudouridine1915-N3)-methyltransferase
MRLTIVAVGRRGPAWLQEALADYLKRFPPGIRITIKDIAPARRGANTPAAAARGTEAEKLRAAATRGSLRIALDEHGRELDTRELARQLGIWRNEDRDVAFLIGGADGLDAALLEDADGVWSLSKLTLQHGMAKLVLVEQLYRAWTILSGHPYHRE